MHIALAADDRYAFACGVCITSVIENCGSEKLDIHVLTPGFSKKNQDKFAQLERKYGLSIDFITLDSSDFKGLKVSRRFPMSIYYRLLLPHLLDCDRVLYLDCDIVVNGSLSPLYDMDMTGHAAVVVEDQCSDDIRNHNRIESDEKYFNSGVMLMNLEWWRENSISEKCLQMLHDEPQRYKYPDQDVMNRLLAGKVIFAEYGFNFQELMYLPHEKLMLHWSKWSVVDKWKDSPVVIHYAGMLKPWFAESAHPEKTLFNKYLSLSPWKDKKPEKFYGFKENMGRLVQNVKNKLFR